MTRSIGHGTFPDNRNFHWVPIRNACRSSCTWLMRPYACDTGLTPRYPSISVSDTNPSDVWQKRARHIRPTLLDDISVKELRQLEIIAVSLDVKMLRGDLLNTKSIRGNMTQLPQSVQESYGRCRAQQHLLILR